MPVTRITTNFTIDKKDVWIDAIHQIMQDVLKIKPYDRLMIVDEKPDSFYQPLNTSGNFVLIEIELFDGRTLNTKRRLYRSLVELMESFDISRDLVRIALIEIPKNNWGVRGGQAACDIELGYKTDI